MVWCRLIVFVLLPALFPAKNVWGQELELIKTTHLPHYPSASALEYSNNRLYVMGDDAPYLLVLNRHHRPVDSLGLFPSKEKRIDKATKADIESATVISTGTKSFLALFSSFSDTNRNKFVFLELQATGKQQPAAVVSSSFFKVAGVEETNLEGSAIINNRLVFSNRANNTHRRNYFIVTDFSKENGITGTPQVVAIDLPQTKGVLGISGLDYVAEKDLLLFTASSEDTPNATSDGTIGDSYLGAIRHISKKLSGDKIQPDALVNLSPVIGKMGLQKIESIAVEEVTKTSLLVHLAADNDNGESTLFKVKLTWKL
ncbi:hypothetical protein V9K67_19425 [Paraflavisolibacter sp. H34]|uniref:DUF6929 family protein n=1 Tax=Huijunlia imazamoxiresistens TaxID=3127457 RepID=UPI0030172509